ncbi:hypothetical protein VFPFJ_10785 [Purpureocillium lilacinum]|uniref:Uncharacterized protein n=1 Tax=Purpureocillium lilacinum TaxID=33203 RepID=A0A179GD99_PURLI|nr:hypothetical protein VFPFJ_10785 [Purpureocillium lilacinum]KAK4090425.1 hypothetical protein Purlil1_5097 [Purpureocillium lilacinum]OAQ75795.1 hypothetical protein VFPFJ_10785 [Purpureocillium lilacinum]OAQ80552.1 hypothetical protein VFPBJ_06137 [Purpureocillium lilacinum]
MSSSRDHHGKRSSKYPDKSYSDKHHSDKHHSSDGRHQSSKAKPSSSGSYPLSFIFVVNRLGFYDAPPLDPETEIDYCRDKWMNTLPPRVWYGYTREYESRVMKYYDGSVTVASEYYWSRGSLGQPGYICKMEEDGSMSVAEEFSSRGVFSCNPHLPLVIIPEDPTTCALTNQKKVMHALHFVHALNPDGISYASTDDLSQIPIQYSACQKHLDGARSSLIPSLVPPSYEPPTTPPRRSRGLSGDLGILLGMMAFSRNTVEEVFVGRSPLWRNRVWHESDHLPRLYPTDTRQCPVGFLVVVCLDPDNPGSTHERLQSFQWGNSAIVKEPSSSKR